MGMGRIRIMKSVRTLIAAIIVPAILKLRHRCLT